MELFLCELLLDAFSNKRKKVRSVMELLGAASVDIIRKAERHDTVLQGDTNA
jgi:hypothetical protein